MTYVLLLKYAWREGSCFPGIDRLAEELGVERKSVMRYTRELQDRGLITIKRRGLGRTNVYHIMRLKTEDVLRLKSHGRDFLKSHHQDTRKSDRWDAKNTQGKKIQNKNNQR